MPRPKATPTAETVELPEGAEVQWAVRHPQGIRMAADEGEARYDLVWLTESWKRTPLARDRDTQPMLIRRVAMPWEDVGIDYGPKVL